MIPTLLVALDPGDTTGHAMRVSIAEMESNFISGEADPYSVMHWLESLLDQWQDHDTLVVAERFTITGATLKKARHNDALETIGAARYICRKYRARYELQDVAAAKKLATDARLRKLGMYLPGHGHANDAARHAVLALVRHGWYSSELEG